MVLPHRFVMRIKRVNTYEAHLMMPVHSKYSNHVRCYSTDHLIQNPHSHLFVSGPAILQNPCPSLPCLWLLASFPYSKIWFFPSWSSQACCCHGNLQGPPGFGGGRGCGLKPRNPTMAVPATTIVGQPPC